MDYVQVSSAESMCRIQSVPDFGPRSAKIDGASPRNKYVDGDWMEIVKWIRMLLYPFCLGSSLNFPTSHPGIIPPSFPLLTCDRHRRRCFVHPRYREEGASGDPLLRTDIESGDEAGRNSKYHRGDSDSITPARLRRLRTTFAFGARPHLKLLWD